jgi:hypothetical protein
MDTAKTTRGGARLGQPSKLKTTSALMVRLTDEQHRLFEAKAALLGLRTASWARMVLLREARAGQGEEK